MKKYSIIYEKMFGDLMIIRKALIDDIDKIMNIYSIAQDFMIKSGNPNQWDHNYPKRELIEHDIEDETSIVICDGDDIRGVFALFSGHEPTYEYIENGRWLNDEEYVTLHRIASDGKAKGIFKSAVDYCKTVSDNIRIDTHADNAVMKRLIEKNGFVKCGTIYVRDGSPRIAYQWCR